MTNRTGVVSVPLDTKDFEGFLDRFDKFRDSVAQVPEVWKSAAKELGAMASYLNKMDENIRKQNSDLAEQNEGEKERTRRLHENEKSWSNMSGHSRDMSKHVLDIGNSLLKWSSLIGGAALFGSLWGVDRLAHSLGDTRTASMGYGVSPSALQAFNTNLGNVLDTQGFLSSMTSMETDITQRRAWYSPFMHGQAMSGDTMKDSMAMLQGLREFATKTSLGMIGPLSRAWQLPADEQTLMRIRNMPEKEWQDTTNRVARDAKAFGLTDQTAQAWQELSKQFTRMKVLLEDKLGGALVKIAPSLERLSAATGDLLAAFLKSPVVGTALDNLSHWLDGLTKSIKSDEFKKSVDSMTSSVGVIAKDLGALEKALSFIDHLISPSAPDAKPSGFMENFQKVQTDVRTQEVNAAADAYAAIMERFTSGRPIEVTPSVARDLPWAKQQAHYAGNPQAALASLLVGDAAMDAALKAHPNDWQKYASPDLKQFLQEFPTDASSPPGGPSRSNIDVLATVGSGSDAGGAGVTGKPVSFPRGSPQPLSSQTLFAPQGTGVTVTIINESGGNVATAISQLGGR